MHKSYTVQLNKIKQLHFRTKLSFQWYMLTFVTCILLALNVTCNYWKHSYNLLSYQINSDSTDTKWWLNLKLDQNQLLPFFKYIAEWMGRMVLATKRQYACVCVPRAIHCAWSVVLNTPTRHDVSPSLNIIYIKSFN